MFRCDNCYMEFDHEPVFFYFAGEEYFFCSERCKEENWYKHYEKR